MATPRTGQIALGGPTGGRGWPRWPPEVPSNCSHAVILWPSPFSSVTLLPHRTNLSGCACAGLNGSSESWNKDTSHIDRVAPLQKETQTQSSYWNIADSQTWLPSHTREAVTAPHTVFEGMLSLSKRTVRRICLSWTTATCHALWTRVVKGQDMTEAHPNVHLGSTVTSAKRWWGHL